MQKHVSRRTGRNEYCPLFVGLQIACEAWCLFVQIPGKLRINLNLTMIGCQHKQCIADFAAHVLIKKLLYHCHAVLYRLLKLSAIRSMMVAGDIDAVEVKEIICRRIAGSCQEFVQVRECTLQRVIRMNLCPTVDNT